MKTLIWLICLLCLVSCDLPVPSFGSTEDRIIIKEIKSSLVEIEWFTYSAAFADFPNFVTIKTKDKTDTICVSTNIADIVDLGNNRIKIGFYGFPKKYERRIEIPLKMQSYTIISDTTYVYKKKK